MYVVDVLFRFVESIEVGVKSHALVVISSVHKPNEIDAVKIHRMHPKYGVFVCFLTPRPSWCHDVVLFSQAPSLVRTILGHGARVNTPRGDRRIPLHTAMRLPGGKKKLSIVATLLVVGADINRPGMLWEIGCIYIFFHSIYYLSRFLEGIIENINIIF